MQGRAIQVGSPKRVFFVGVLLLAFVLSARSGRPGELRPFEPDVQNSPQKEAAPSQKQVEASVYERFWEKVRALNKEQRAVWRAKFSKDRAEAIRKAEWDAVEYYDHLIRIIEEYDNEDLPRAAFTSLVLLRAAHSAVVWAFKWRASRGRAGRHTARRV